MQCRSLALKTTGEHSASLHSARCLSPRNRGQSAMSLLVYLENLMSLLQRVCKTLGVLGLAVAFPALVSGQSTNYYAHPREGIFSCREPLPGDQVNPSVAVNTSGGYIVWQDNITDGSGLGISAVQLDATFSPIYGNFRVNVQGSNDQENAQVTLLNGGGAAFVWQGGVQGFQHIYARFLSASNIWVTGDVMVNTRHQLLSGQSRHRHSDEWQRHRHLGQLWPGQCGRFSGGLCADSHPHRPESRRRVSRQPIHFQ